MSPVSLMSPAAPWPVFPRRDAAPEAAGKRAAGELHATLLRARELGWRARPYFLAALLAMAETRLYRFLGFQSLAHYALTYLDCSYLELQWLLSLARALGFLPACRAAWIAGTLPAPKLEAILPVATPATEVTWLDLATTLPLEHVQAAAWRGREEPDADAHLSPLRFRYPGWYSSELPVIAYA